MDEPKVEFRDKRRVDTEGNVKPGAEAQPTTQPTAQPASQAEPRPKAGPEPKAPARPAAADAAAGKTPRPSTDPRFIPFIMNISAMAFMAMGLGEVATEPNLPEAKYVIDSLDALARKTAGNLSAEEERALKSVLYELKMNYAKVAKSF